MIHRLWEGNMWVLTIKMFCMKPMSSVAPVGRMLRRTAALCCPFLKLSSHLLSLDWNAGQASPLSESLLSVMQWFRIIRTMRLSVFLYLISYCLTLSLSHSQFSPFDFLNNLFKPPSSWTTTRQKKELKSPVTRDKILFRPHPTVSPSFFALQVFFLLYNIQLILCFSRNTERHWKARISYHPIPKLPGQFQWISTQLLELYHHITILGHPQPLAFLTLQE